MTTTEKLWATVALMMKLLLLACSSGCSGAIEAAAVPELPTRYDFAINIAEVIVKQNVPNLPDDLKKPDGLTPIPQDENLLPPSPIHPPAGPVERPTNSTRQPTVDPAPGPAPLDITPQEPALPKGGLTGLAPSHDATPPRPAEPSVSNEIIEAIASQLESLAKSVESLQKKIDRMCKPAPAKAAPKAAAPAPKTVAHGSLFYNAQMWPGAWDWHGDLRQHLTEQPHNYTRSSLDALTDGQVVGVHNAWHEAHKPKPQVQMQSPAKSRKAARQQYQMQWNVQGPCPNGRCPI